MLTTYVRRGPRFKWASQHTHGGHRPFGTTPGTAESKKPVLLIRQSNSGLVDPLHMTAISLTHITASLLLSRPDTDRVIWGERSLHTGEVQGSIPCAPTIVSPLVAAEFISLLLTISARLLQGIAMVRPVVTPIDCSWPLLKE